MTNFLSRNIGIVILAAGFATFFVALLYCLCICQETRHHQEGKPQQVSICYKFCLVLGLKALVFHA